MRHYDVIIVGGGSTGSVLANRLTEDAGTSVLVLEAGRPDSWWDVFIQMPAAVAFPIGSRHHDWRFETEPEPFMQDRRIYHARGKILGGSGSINGMVFQRGNPLDYEGWAAEPGMGQWDYAHCLPYFKRLETCLAGADEWRGGDGPIPLERADPKNPLVRAFFEAAVEAGYSRTDDVNGYRQEGFASFDRTIRRGRRVSASRAYLHPVMNRPNLDVRCRRLVTKLVCECDRVTGVEVSDGKTTERILAGEVILAGGVFNSPQILQLSGIGDARHLASVGVPAVHDLPAVGTGLQDHLEVYIQYACKEPVSLQPALKTWKRPLIGLQWLLARSGPGATNHFETGGFVRSTPATPYPNLMFHFLPVAIRYDRETAVPGGHGYQIHVGPMTSDARGSVRIKSADPFDHPALRFNYLSTERDRREWVQAVRCARDILTQPAFDRYNAGEMSPGADVETDDEILEWVSRNGETGLHPCGSCRMGTGDDAVVDPATMRVRGLDGVRIVDASVIPAIPNANIYAPTLMIAEKAADLIRGDTPLPPLRTSFYRHDDGAPTAEVASTAEA
jgi:choline dehydrogenase